jgi:hypothetical protein
MNFTYKLWRLIKEFQLDWLSAHKRKTRRSFGLLEYVRAETQNNRQKSFNIYDHIPGDPIWHVPRILEFRDYWGNPLQITSFEWNPNPKYGERKVKIGLGWVERRNCCNKTVIGFGKYSRLKNPVADLEENDYYYGYPW